MCIYVHIRMSIMHMLPQLEHMGKETIKKLADLRVAGQQAGMDIEIPENSVQKGERLYE